MGVVDGDVIEFEQRGKFRQLKANWDAWKQKWEQGSEWGIVGGTPLNNLPNTVLEQVTEHGEATFARDGARTIEGLGELLTAVSEILDGDEILVEHLADLEDSIKQMEIVLGVRKWNPRNIPFHTVTRFVETEDEKKPDITRGKMYGHYRTEAYNEYVEWALVHKKNFKGKQADSDPSWSNAKMGQAKPPLWRAITGENNEGMLAIARDALEAVDKIKIPGVVQFGVYSSSQAPQGLSQIASVREHVLTVLNNASIYPRGKQRAPVKDRLNAAFNNHTYAIANEDEANSFKTFIRGLDKYVGVEKMKQVKLRFPANNLALNKLIKLVMGDEMETFQKPGTIPEDVKPGLTLKAVIKRASTMEELLTKKISCMKPDCPYGPNQSQPEVTTQQAKSCSKKDYSSCVGNRI